MKALLQLALLSRSWEKAAPSSPGSQELAATVERVWQRADFPRLLTAKPRYAKAYQLMYGALAPATLTEGPRAVLAEVAADGFLTPRGKSPYIHLETRYYADLAGVGHQLHSYRKLYETSLLARQGDRQPVDDLDVCDVTHTVFYLSDFGFRDPGLTGDALERARRTVCLLTDRCVHNGAWDLVGKLVLAQYCLGTDPLRSPSGAAGLRMLADAQLPDGAIPGRSAGERAGADATTVEFFRKAYQATLVTALTAVIVSHGPPDGPPGDRSGSTVDSEERRPAMRGAR